MQGIVQRAVVGNDGICRCQIQRTALCFHLAQCVHAGRKRPAAAHGQRIHRSVDEQNDAVIPNNGTLDEALRAALEALDEIFDS